MEKTLIEIIKYGTKFFTELDINNTLKKRTGKIYAAALNNIFTAMKGVRIFDRFGFNLPNKIDKPEGSKIVHQFVEFKVYIKNFDWLITTVKTMRL